MQAFAQALDLVDDPAQIAEYDAYHEQVWPEVVRGLRAIGITRMKLFRTGTRLFMYCEAEDDFDPQRNYQEYTMLPRCEEWDLLMREYQQRIPTASPQDPWWTPMHLLFDLESTEG